MSYTTKVLVGNQEGRRIGFPTINLSPTILPETTVKGVYSSVVKYEDKEYLGALYYGPRLIKNESHTVLEIHVLDFNDEIYGEVIEFELREFIRGTMNFQSFEEMRMRIEKDIEEIRKIKRVS